MKPRLFSSLLLVAAAWAFLPGCPCSSEVEPLLHEGSRLEADGLYTEAEAPFDRVLEMEEGENAEARIRKAFCSYHAGDLDKRVLRKKVTGSAAGELPPGFDDMVRAGLAAVEGDDRARTQFLENALGRSGERLRFDLHHRLDHRHGFAASELFCLCFSIRRPALIPMKEEASEEEKAAGEKLHLFQLFFRPSEKTHLTVISWSPDQGASIVFPLEGTGKGGPFEKGSRVVLQVTHPRENRWVPLSSEPESCLFAVVSASIPDRSRLVEIVARSGGAAGGGPEKTVAELERLHGAGSALHYFYQ